MGVTLQAWIEKKVYRVETCWLSGKKKVLNAVVSKEGHVDCLLGYEKSHHYWFSIANFFDKIHFIYWMTLIIFY